MKTTRTITGYPVIDEILDSIAPTAGHQHDYDPETGSCFCGDVWDESRDEQPPETASEWVTGGKFVSDCVQTMAGMFTVKDNRGEFVAAFDNQQARDTAIIAVNSRAELVAALEQIRTWLIAPATDRLTLAEMRQVVNTALANARRC